MLLGKQLHEFQYFALFQQRKCVPVNLVDFVVITAFTIDSDEAVELHDRSGRTEHVGFLARIGTGVYVD